MGSIDFTPENARRELDSYGAMKGPCLACGGSDLRVGALLTGQLAIVDDELDLTDAKAARSVSVICMHCGFIRFHDWNRLIGH